MEEKRKKKGGKKEHSCNSGGGGDNSVNDDDGKFVCEACASAGRILSYYFDSNFHPCVLDPVIENFRTKASPIARPVKNFDQSK